MEPILVFLLCFLLFLVCCCCYLLPTVLFSTAGRCQRPLPSSIRRLLLVIAHPDDECMFFGPAVLELIADGRDVYLLCLSSGDNEGLGEARKRELRDAVAVLGLRPEAMTIVEHSALPDSTSSCWDRSLVAEIIDRHAQALDVDCLLSFDRSGVSGHGNHCAIAHAVRSMLLLDEEDEQRRLQGVRLVLELETVGLLSKYGGAAAALLDMLCSMLWRRRGVYVYCIGGWSEWTRLQRAMGKHRSQLRWFRRLYMISSRYVWLNTLRTVDESKEPLY